MSAKHINVQYVDGRQLSLVVAPADARAGLPPGAVALVDKTGRLASTWEPESFAADQAQQREWAFTAWWTLRDAVKHAGRDKVWRAITSLELSRGAAWQLHAAASGVHYPLFGAVSVQNADLPAPAGLPATLVSAAAGDAPTTSDVLRAVRALADVLIGLTQAHDVAGIHAAAMLLLRTVEARREG